LYAGGALYALWCAYRTGTKRLFYAAVLLILALDIPFVALGSGLNSRKGVAPRVAYTLHLCALGLQFHQLASLMQHHLNIYRRVVSSPPTHEKRASLFKGVVTGASGVYFSILVLRLFTHTSEPLRSAFANDTVVLPLLVTLVGLMSFVLSVVFLLYVHFITKVLGGLGERSSINKRRLQLAGLSCAVIFLTKTVCLLVLNYAPLPRIEIPQLVVSCVYHWIPMVCPLLIVAHVHVKNTARRAAQHYEVEMEVFQGPTTMPHAMA
jgi:hypothetical protein